jgi:exodeoxyribonuclease VII large subunit
MTREQLSFAVERGMERQAAFLNMASEVVDARAPEKILKLGFAVVRCDGHAVTSAEGLSGKEVDIQLATGNITATVK